MNSQFCRKWQIARFENHPGQTPFGPAGTVEENRTGVSSDELDEMSLDKIIEYIYTSSPNLQRNRKALENAIQKHKVHVSIDELIRVQITQYAERAKQEINNLITQMHRQQQQSGKPCTLDEKSAIRRGEKKVGQRILELEKKLVEQKHADITYLLGLYTEYTDQRIAQESNDLRKEHEDIFRHTISKDQNIQEILELLSEQERCSREPENDEINQFVASNEDASQPELKSAKYSSNREQILQNAPTIKKGKRKQVASSQQDKAEKRQPQQKNEHKQDCSSEIKQFENRLMLIQTATQQEEKNRINPKISQDFLKKLQILVKKK